MIERKDYLARHCCRHYDAGEAPHVAIDQELAARLGTASGHRVLVLSGGVVEERFAPSRFALAL